MSGNLANMEKMLIPIYCAKHVISNTCTGSKLDWRDLGKAIEYNVRDLSDTAKLVKEDVGYGIWILDKSVTNIWLPLPK